MKQAMNIYLYDIKTQKITLTSREKIIGMIGCSQDNIYKAKKYKSILRGLDCFVLTEEELTNKKLLSELLTKDQFASFKKDEVWLQCPLIDSKYLVSNYGRIKVVYKNGKERIIRTGRKNHSKKDFIYARCIDCNGQRKEFKLKVLVYSTFNKDYRKGMTISHFDNDIYNCSYTNLFQPTRKQLSKMMIKNRKNKNFILQLDQTTLKPLAIYYSQADAQRHTGIHQASISKAIINKENVSSWISMAGGYRWDRITSIDELENLQDKYEYLELKPIKI